MGRLSPKKTSKFFDDSKGSQTQLPCQPGFGCRAPDKLRNADALLQERERVLVQKLTTRLQLYVDGDKQAFEETMKAEADKLADSTFGVPMLKTIGCACLLSLQFSPTRF